MAEQDEDYNNLLGTKSPRDTLIQVAISVALGLGAFLTFCVRSSDPRCGFKCIDGTQVLRPRWTSLYAARKQQRSRASPLPELPSTTFGWIPALWRITEQQILASAGLDAYVVRPTLKASSLLTLMYCVVLALLQVGTQIPNGHSFLCACRFETRSRCIS